MCVCTCAWVSMRFALALHACIQSVAFQAEPGLKTLGSETLMQLKPSEKTHASKVQEKNLNVSAIIYKPKMYSYQY